MDTQTDHPQAHNIKACGMAINAIEIIRDNLQPRTKTGLARAMGYVDSAKRWLTQIDRLLSMSVYSDKLSKSLYRCTTDPDQCLIEVHPHKRVIVIDGAFDLDKLRDFIISV